MKVRQAVQTRVNALTQKPEQRQVNYEWACGTCMFWCARGGGDRVVMGECRAQPPGGLRNRVVGEATWSATERTDWCGAWQPAEGVEPLGPKGAA